MATDDKRPFRYIRPAGEPPGPGDENLPRLGEDWMKEPAAAEPERPDEQGGPSGEEPGPDTEGGAAGRRQRRAGDRLEGRARSGEKPGTVTRVAGLVLVALAGAAGLVVAARPVAEAAPAGDERLLRELVQAQRDQAGALKDIASELREMGRRCGR